MKVLWIGLLSRGHIDKLRIFDEKQPCRVGCEREVSSFFVAGVVFGGFCSLALVMVEEKRGTEGEACLSLQKKQTNGRKITGGMDERGLLGVVCSSYYVKGDLLFAIFCSYVL